MLDVELFAVYSVDENKTFAIVQITSKPQLQWLQYVYMFDVQAIFT